MATLYEYKIKVITSFAYSSFDAGNILMGGVGFDENPDHGTSKKNKGRTTKL
jgi:hypothetical protein